MRNHRFEESIAEAADEIRRLHSRIDEAARTRDRSPADRARWEEAVSEFHANYGRLAFPGGYEGALARIASGDAFFVEAALSFLEVRPYFFRSGYMYKDILRKLRHADLLQPHQERLAQIVTAYEFHRAERKRSKLLRNSECDGPGNVA